MKKFITLSCTLVCFYLHSHAQHEEVLRISGKDYPAFIAKERYKYPEFLRSQIYLKNGDTAFVRININYFDEQIKYVGTNGDTMNLGKKDIKYITTDTDTTFVQNKSLYEWVSSSSIARIVMKHTMTYKTSETQSGVYGTSSSNFKVEGHTGLLGGITLEPTDILIFSSETTYYIEFFKEPGFVVANKKNLAELFPKSDVEEYITENKLDLNNLDDLLKAFTHAHKRK